MYKPILLFDGVCNFCNWMVRLIIKNDKKKNFLFATFQSKFAATIFNQEKTNLLQFDSLLLIENKKIYQQSTAVLKILNRFPWYWKFAQLFWLVPKFIRDAAYTYFAKNRYRWFGKTEQCFLPTQEIKDRFLD